METGTQKMDRTEAADRTEKMERLFVYGTLNPQQPPPELEDVLAHFVFIGEATVRARLFQVQQYPGLVLEATAEPVTGRLFDIPADSWARLDEYEGYDPEVKESSLFLRKKTKVTRLDGVEEEVWIYLYNRHG